jgi:pSer/pThr/pTyr-binding forkhead associated (FHA) protein
MSWFFLVGFENLTTIFPFLQLNGTFVNQQKLQRNGVEVDLQHGDIVSLVGSLEHGESLSSNHASAIPSFGFLLYHC